MKLLLLSTLVLTSWYMTLFLMNLFLWQHSHSKDGQLRNKLPKQSTHLNFIIAETALQKTYLMPR